MSALQDFDLDAYSVAPDQQNWYKELVSQMFWRWYDANTDTLITTVSVWVFKKKIFVKDLRSLFEILFGSAPNGTTT